MPEPNLPRHYPGDLRAALLATAARMVAETGSSDVSLRAVARSVGVSHAAPAHHFGDKAGLLDALAEQGFELLLDRMREELRAGGGDPGRRLLLLGQAYSTFARDEPGRFEVMFSSARELRTSAGEETMELLEECCRAVLARSEHSTAIDPVVAALMSWSLIHGLCVLLRSGQIPSDKGTETEIVATVLSAHAALLAGD
ncbi:MAG: TetR/AcrR family transcriptional regulator [Actinomycetes bacterium]|jgi:AcrR family transcriptional regulator|nr:TetR family transcriptional regulator [Actinomycetota bacterium]